MRAIRIGFVISCLVGALALPVRAEAASVAAVQSITGGVLATSGSDQLYGWIFDVLTPINVTALGVFDDDGDGLAVAHDVGIYRQSTQTLLGSLNLSVGTPGSLVSGFRYVDLGSPLALTADRYVIVMTMPAFNGDTQWVSATAIGTASEIAYITSAFDGSSSLAFPNPSLNGSFAQGLVGPNFLFDSAGAPVPEPASMLLLGTGLAGAIARRRSRRR